MKEWKCQECNREFQQKNHLESHLCGNHKEYKCLECAQVFYRNSHLKRHEKKHSKKYKCPHCCLEFELQSLMIKHKNTHQFECNQCLKKFNNPTVLKKHIRNHAKVECQYCFKPLTKKALKVHIDTVHLNIHSFHCECGKSFKHKHLLQRHITRGCSNDHPTCPSTPVVESDHHLPIEISPSTEALDIECITGTLTQKRLKCNEKGCWHSFNNQYLLQSHQQAFHY